MRPASIKDCDIGQSPGARPIAAVLRGEWRRVRKKMWLAGDCHRAPGWRLYAGSAASAACRADRSGHAGSDWRCDCNDREGSRFAKRIRRCRHLWAQDRRRLYEDRLPRSRERWICSGRAGRRRRSIQRQHSDQAPRDLLADAAGSGLEPRKRRGIRHISHRQRRISGRTDFHAAPERRAICRSQAKNADAADRTDRRVSGC